MWSVYAAQISSTGCVHFARSESIELIVIGARGRHMLIDILSGSTATGVVRAARCDVYVIQEREESGG